MNNAANALLALGDAAGAEALYREAAEAHPESADIANNLGWCLAGQGRAEEACAWFAQALALDPHHARAAGDEAAGEEGQHGGCSIAALPASVRT